MIKILSLKQSFYNIVTKVYKDVDSDSTPIPIHAMFYVVLGQYLKNVKIFFGGEKIPLRISYFWISPSRTGKGQLYKITDTIARKLGLTTAIETDITDAGLIGTVDEKAIEYNYKNKLEQGDAGYKDPIVLGDLLKYDIIFFREVKKLLTPSQNTQMLLSILQEALDEPGYIRKKLRSKYPVEGTCTASIIATTYYAPEIEKTLLEQGFFMRVPLYCRDFSITEISKLRKDIIDMFSVTEIKDIEPDIDNFVNDVKKINNSSHVLNLDKKAIERLQSTNKQMEILMRKTMGPKLNILKSISQTVIDIAVKVGGINACIDNRTVINESDISGSIAFIKGCVDTILNKIDVSEKQDEKSSFVRKSLLQFKVYLANSKIDKISKDDFSKDLKDKLGMGRNRALNIINKLVSENYLKVITGDKNTKFLVLNEDMN